MDGRWMAGWLAGRMSGWLDTFRPFKCMAVVVAVVLRPR